MRLGDVGEYALVERLRGFLDPRGPLPAGEDDAAAWAAGDGGWWVASVDASVEGRHFDLAWQAPEEVGRRALGLALGDLAAKGAAPAYGLASLTAPPAWRLEVAEGVYRGMAAMARATGLALVGGDTTSSTGPAVLVLTVVGRTAEQPRPRTAARPGWALAVTGPLGGAALALQARTHFEIQPRLAEGARLTRLGLVCGDISDGLAAEAMKFRCGVRIDAARLPVVPGADWRTAMTSGEEAELVVVGPPEALAGAGLAAVGELVDGPPGAVVRTADGEVRMAASNEHFRGG